MNTALKFKVGDTVTASYPEATLVWEGVVVEIYDDAAPEYEVFNGTTDEYEWCCENDIGQADYRSALFYEAELEARA